MGTNFEMVWWAFLGEGVGRTEQIRGGRGSGVLGVILFVSIRGSNAESSSFKVRDHGPVFSSFSL